MTEELDFEEMFKPYCLLIRYENENILVPDTDTLLKTKEESFELFKNYFNEGYGSIDIDENLIQISSGGWSDNQYLISCFEKTLWWQSNFFAKIAGGHYFFNTDRHAEKEWDIVKK